jgi:glycosyltransferase involved in cell wall biosynthesis
LQPRPQSDRSPGGPSRARNRGIKAARGVFVAFCDDDDLWLRNDHLDVALRALKRYGGDLFFGNLRISRNGEVIGPDFYGAARAFLTRCPLPGEADLFEVSQRDRALSLKHVFLHCNSLVVSRHLLHACGLYWEKLTMAEDRDIALRLLDRAERVIYRSTVVADYDRTVRSGLCRSYTDDEIRQFIILAMLHAESKLRNKALRGVARGYRAWMLVEMAQSALDAARSGQARELAWQSLLLRPTGAAMALLAKSAAGISAAAAAQPANRTEAR